MATKIRFGLCELDPGEMLWTCSTSAVTPVCSERKPSRGAMPALRVFLKRKGGCRFESLYYRGCSAPPYVNFVSIIITNLWLQPCGGQTGLRGWVRGTLGSFGRGLNFAGPIPG
jgi:hypothetical protein